MTIVTKNRKSHIQKSEFMEERFDRFFGEIIADSETEYSQDKLKEIRTEVFDAVYARETIEADKLFDLIIRFSNDKISALNPEFTKLSASTLRRKLYKQASKNRGFDYKKGYGDYYSLVVQLVEQGIYTEDMTDKYSKEELNKLGQLIDVSKDKLFDYAGLYLMSSNYLQKGYNGEVLELPQERFLSVAAYLMQDEPVDKRLDLIEQAYWALSNHYVGLATPTLSNGATPNGSLSSCHIITPDDDLDSIMNSIKQTAKFSQNGSGIGILLSLLRANGSWIRGRKGCSTGILHPARVFSVLAEYVNQLNQRVAGIALYLNVTHYDIFEFLELRLKTGSQEVRAHSIKTAVTLPDEFMRRLKNNQTWTVYDPYEFKEKMGVDFNFLYDAKQLQENETPNEKDHAFTYWYRKAEERTDFEISKTVKATDIYKAIYVSRKTGGTPYMYYSDTAARMNPNGHVGMPMGSNLC